MAISASVPLLIPKPEILNEVTAESRKYVLSKVCASGSVHFLNVVFELMVFDTANVRQYHYSKCPTLLSPPPLFLPSAEISIQE